LGLCCEKINRKEKNKRNFSFHYRGCVLKSNAKEQ
jgi:hypothetical protein